LEERLGAAKPVDDSDYLPDIVTKVGAAEKILLPDGRNISKEAL
jgi:hypothetical protein